MGYSEDLSMSETTVKWLIQPSWNNDIDQVEVIAETKCFITLLSRDSRGNICRAFKFSSC
jgi:hypothetical protein